MDRTVRTIDRNRPGELIAAFQRAGCRPLLLTHTRLVMMLSWMRFPHIERDEFDDAAKLRMELLEDRIGARRHRAGERAGDQENRASCQIARLQLSAACSRQVELRQAFTGLGCAFSELHVLGQNLRRDVLIGISFGGQMGPLRSQAAAPRIG
ncbi:hypothetical protein VQ045_15100 [Aurantimonas sp. E1-2-R+4]|uniref:hypothetical protein n=1 Tax=Aurantimonas sp. E1-2-R+4 TaxID=3113714 RepID=UPI002F93A905